MDPITRSQQRPREACRRGTERALRPLYQRLESLASFAYQRFGRRTEQHLSTWTCSAAPQLATATRNLNSSAATWLTEGLGSAERGGNRRFAAASLAALDVTSFWCLSPRSVEGDGGLQVRTLLHFLYN